MWTRTTAALATAAALSCAWGGMANAHHLRHHRRADVVQYAAPPAVPPAPYGGRLVAHPAFNIACMTRDRATRALPCDQPVWVYGSPCEVDLGLGRSRPCD
jgi:hypothetical protein